MVLALGLDLVSYAYIYFLAWNYYRLDFFYAELATRCKLVARISNNLGRSTGGSFSVNTEKVRMAAHFGGTKSATWARNPRSDVWKYMKRVTKTEKRMQGISSATSWWQIHQATSNLREYLERVHTDELPGLRKGPSQQTSTMSFLKPMDTSNSKPLETNHIDGITKRLVEWCALDIRPLFIAQGEGFRRLFCFVQPCYVIPSQTYLSMRLRKQHEDGKKALWQALLKVPHVSLTSYGWISNAIVSYATYTTHYVDRNW